LDRHRMIMGKHVLIFTKKAGRIVVMGKLWWFRSQERKEVFGFLRAGMALNF